MGPLWRRHVDYRAGGSVQTPHGILYTSAMTLSGQALMVAEQDLAEIGYLGEDYGIYGEEDADFCVRAHYAGLMYAFAAESFLRNLQSESKEGMTEAEKLRISAQNTGEADRYGIYRVNEYLFSMYVRKTRVPLKYEIDSVQGRRVRLKVRKDYLEFRKRLMQVARRINSYLASDMKLKLAVPGEVERFREMLGEG